MTRPFVVDMAHVKEPPDLLDTHLEPAKRVHTRELLVRHGPIRTLN